MHFITCIFILIFLYWWWSQCLGGKKTIKFNASVFAIIKQGWIALLILRGCCSPVGIGAGPSWLLITPLTSGFASAEHVCLPFPGHALALPPESIISFYMCAPPLPLLDSTLFSKSLFTSGLLDHPPQLPMTHRTTLHIGHLLPRCLGLFATMHQVATH